MSDALVVGAAVARRFQQGDAVLDVFNMQRAAGTAIVIATHSEALASHADRVLRMHDGRINDV